MLQSITRSRRRTLLVAGVVVAATLGTTGVALAATDTVRGRACVDDDGTVHYASHRYPCLDSQKEVEWPANVRGQAGPAGPRGERGETGPRGATGPVGPKGETGPAGPTGAAGVEGPAGPAGPAGGTGANGSSGVLGYHTKTYAPNQTSNVLSLYCDAGESLLSGGYSTGGGTYYRPMVRTSTVTNSQGLQGYEVAQPQGANASVALYVLCVKTPT